jgi:hypothetical protein
MVFIADFLFASPLDRRHGKWCAQNRQARAATRLHQTHFCYPATIDRHAPENLNLRSGAWPRCKNSF